jgi:hypothetical protein
MEMAITFTSKKPFNEKTPLNYDIDYYNLFTQHQSLG